MLIPFCICWGGVEADSLWNDRQKDKCKKIQTTLLRLLGGYWKAGGMMLISHGINILFTLRR